MKHRLKLCFLFPLTTLWSKQVPCSWVLLWPGGEDAEGEKSATCSSERAICECVSMNSERLTHSFFRNGHFSSPERFCTLAENKFQWVVYCLDSFESIKGVCWVSSQVCAKLLKQFQSSSSDVYIGLFDVICSRYGLPVRYQALLLQTTDRKHSKKLEDELSSLFMHLDPTATASKGEVCLNYEWHLFQYNFWYKAEKLIIF